MSSKVEKRRREILNIVNTDGVAYIAEMATLFKVTKETIRNDFDYLSDIYKLPRIHGGIKKNQEKVYSEEYRYQEKKLINIEEKKRICFKAVEILEDGDHIYVDGGSTLCYLLNFLSRKKNITIVTPSIAFLMKYILEGYDNILEKYKHRLIFIGGEVNTNILTTFGVFLNKTVEDINFDKMIISADAVNIKGGITDSDEISYEIAKNITKQSHKKLLLVDSSKFNLVANYKVIDWDRLDYIVTEKSLDEEWKNHFIKYGIEYIKA